MNPPTRLHARLAAQRRLFFWTQLWEAQSEARQAEPPARFGSPDAARNPDRPADEDDEAPE